MRFRVHLKDPAALLEATERERLERAAVELFRQAGERAHLDPAVDRAAARRIESWLGSKLAQLAPGILVEVHCEGDSFRVLVAPAEDDGLDPLARLLVECAPAGGRVRCVRHRPREELTRSLEIVRESTGLDLSDARVRVGFSRGHLLEVLLRAPTIGSGLDDTALDAANLLVSLVLGGERFDDWIGAVDVAPLARGGSLRVVPGRGADANEEGIPVSELADAVSNAVDGALGSLDAAPYHELAAQAAWVLFELDPNAAASAERMGDVVVFSTCVPEAMRSFLEGARFSSCRFSRHGERFFYVAVQVPHLSPEARLKERMRLEEAVERALVPGGLGVAVGAGVGLAHVYLVVALTRFEIGLEQLWQALCELAPRGPAWLLCCDTAWSKEWRGVGTALPPPFLR